MRSKHIFLYESIYTLMVGLFVPGRLSEFTNIFTLSHIIATQTRSMEKRLQLLLNAAAIYYVYDLPFAARLSRYFFKAGVLKVQESS
jgi:hypothetical protein